MALARRVELLMIMTTKHAVLCCVVCHLPGNTDINVTSSDRQSSWRVNERNRYSQVIRTETLARWQLSLCSALKVTVHSMIDISHMLFVFNFCFDFQFDLQ